MIADEDLAAQFDGYKVEFQDLKIFGADAWAVKFRRPEGGSINSVDFLFRRGLLSVTGDLGAATYWWGSQLHLAFFEKIATNHAAASFSTLIVSRPSRFAQAHS